jgi:hypothetical protein
MQEPIRSTRDTDTAPTAQTAGLASGKAARTEPKAKDERHAGRDAAVAGAAGAGAGAYAAHEHNEHEAEESRADPILGGKRDEPIRSTRDTAPGAQTANPANERAARTEPKAEDKKSHAGRDAAVAGAAGAGAGAYAAHEYHEHEAEQAEAQRQKELAEQEEARQRQLQKDQKAHDKLMAKEEKQYHKDEKKHQKELEKEEKAKEKAVAKEEKQHHKELEKEQKEKEKAVAAAEAERQRQFEKEQTQAREAEEAERKRREKEAAGVAAVGAGGGLAYAEHEHDQKKQEANPFAAGQTMGPTTTTAGEPYGASQTGQQSAGTEPGHVAAGVRDPHEAEALTTAHAIGRGSAEEETDRNRLHKEPKEKKPGILKRIFRRRQNKDTGEDEDYSTDEEDHHVAEAGAVGAAGAGVAGYEATKGHPDQTHDYNQTGDTTARSAAPSNTYEAESGGLQKPSYNPFSKQDPIGQAHTTTGSEAVEAGTAGTYGQEATGAHHVDTGVPYDPRHDPDAATHLDEDGQHRQASAEGEQRQSGGFLHKIVEQLKPLPADKNVTT